MIVVGLVYGVLGLTFIVQSTFMYSFALDAGTPPVTAGHLVSAMGMLSIFAGPPGAGCRTGLATPAA